MATVETQENKREIEYEVYPGGELLKAIYRFLSEKTKIKIAMVSQHSGDVVFTATCDDLGITQQTLSHPFCRTHAFANLLGELLVRQHLDMFADRVMGKNYDALVKAYNHHEFGLRTHGAELLLFQFHVSLIHRLLNECISREIADDVARITLACPKKTKREEGNPGVTTYAEDENNLRLIVTKADDVSRVFEKAIESILDFYSINNKEVSVARNALGYEIQIKDIRK